MRFPWTISFPCVAMVAKLSKWASKLSAKFAPWVITWVYPWNRLGLIAGTMLWTSWAAAAAPNESSPLAKCVSRLRFLWRGLNFSFQSLHIWSAFGFPSHSWWSLGKDLVRRMEYMANAASQLSVIGSLARWDFFLCLPHCHDELGNAGVTAPVAGEFAG